MLQAIAERRSIRKFTNRPVEHAKIIELLKAGMQAPSAHNQQSWEFIVVDDHKILDELAQSVQWATPLATANCAIVVLAKPHNTAPEFVTIELGACIENILLEVVNQKLGAVWLGVQPDPTNDRHQIYQRLLKLDSERLVYACLAIGYPQNPTASFIDRYDASKVYYNSFAEPFNQ